MDDVNTIMRQLINVQLIVLLGLIRDVAAKTPVEEQGTDGAHEGSFSIVTHEKRGLLIYDDEGNRKRRSRVSIDSVMPVDPRCGGATHGPN